ncbi:hypothetical protein [Trueperella sp.]|uniref:hypothetical protein n=1 Tax=Trueperella sp. TaxID=2699835 RepID=UPI0022EB7DCD|nr:hypothetical protein [Trueperella sp.]
MSNDERADDEEAPTNKYGFSEEDMATLMRARKRNLALAIVAGLVLAVLGFFAAQNISGGDAAAWEAMNVWSL